MRRIAFFWLLSWLSFTQAQEVVSPRIVIQNSFVSAFQHHHGKRLFSHMNIGDPLKLIREPGDLDDSNAIRVEWQGHMIGYLPQMENAALARQMDLGNRLQGRIIGLSKHRDPNRRVEMEIYVSL